MKQVFVLLLTLISFNVFAQKIRVTDTSNKWTEGYSSWNYQYVQTQNWFYKGDTLIISHNYSNTGYLLIREDTISKRIYAIDRVYKADTEEHLLYDFSLNVGDTFLSRKNQGWGIDTFIFTVKSIDSVIIDSVYHKIWTLKNVYYNTSQYYFIDYRVIEGIGSEYGLMFPLMPGLFESSTSLICFKNKGKIITVPNPSGGNDLLSPTTCLLSIKTQHDVNKTTTIVPNPANEYSTINFPYTIQRGQLLIINSLGQVVADKEIHNRQQIRLGSLSASGLYYYKVIDKQNGNNFSGRFVYQ